MFGLNHFSIEEQSFLAERLESLLKDNVVTGINTYSEIVDLDVCLPLSYLHHSTKHEEYLKFLMQQKKRLTQIAETWKKREKQAIYRWDQAWQIKPEEKQLGIEFYILGTAKKFDADAIARAERLSDIYSGNEMVVAKDKGYDLNFSIDSRITLIALLNLFRKHASQCCSVKTDSLSWMSMVSLNQTQTRCRRHTAFQSLFTKTVSAC